MRVGAIDLVDAIRNIFLALLRPSRRDCRMFSGHVAILGACRTDPACECFYEHIRTNVAIVRVVIVPILSSELENSCSFMWA